MVLVKFANRNYTADELREVMLLVETQETTDRYENTSIRIEGDYATIEVELDDMGDITVL